jgi:plastocyanin
VRRTVVLASLSLLVLTASPARAAVVSVGPGGDNVFDPQVTTLTAPGQAVTWDWDAGSHNVRQDTLLFYSGAPTSDPTATFDRVFSAGSFHYYCEPHGYTTGGMAGRVRVPPSVSAAPAGPPFRVRWATAATNVGQVFDVQYRIGGGNWVTWRTDATARAKVFGANGKPVVVKAGRTYGFRVRTQATAAKPLSRSDWSPIRTFQA